MTVKLKCGNYKAEDMGGYYEIEANCVMDDDLSINGKKDGVDKSALADAIDKLTQKELIKILKESDFDAEDIVDVDCSPYISWGY